MRIQRYYTKLMLKYPVLDKKIRINAILAVALLFGVFVLGLSWEYKAHRVEINDILEVANDSCTVRIATIKETCRR